VCVVLHSGIPPLLGFGVQLAEFAILYKKYEFLSLCGCECVSVRMCTIYVCIYIIYVCIYVSFMCAYVVLLNVFNLIHLCIVPRFFWIMFLMQVVFLSLTRCALM
jgi:hypothetical protein